MKRPTKKTIQKILQKRELILLFLILLTSAYLRFPRVMDSSFAFTYDVGRDMLAVRNIVTHFDLPLIGPTTGFPGLFYGPWWYYSLIPAFVIGGGNPQAVAMFIALTGLVTVILGYIVGKRLISVSFGLLVASLLGFSSAMVSSTTQIWNPNLAPVLLALLLLILLGVVKTHSQKKLIYDRKTILALVVLGFLTGLSIDAEVLYGVLLAVSLFLFLLLFIFRKALFSYVFVLIGLILAFSPRILFELRHDFIMTRTISNNLQSGMSSPDQISFFTHASSAVFELKNLWDWTLALNNHLLGSFLLVLTILVIGKKYSSYPQPLKRFIQFISLTLIVFLVGLMFFFGAVWGHYLVGLPVLYIVLFSICLYTLTFSGKLSKFFMGVILLFLFLQLQPAQILSKYTEPRYIGDASVYRNQLEVIDYIYQQAQGKDFNKLVYTPPVHDYTYQYLFLWYGQKTYGYIPRDQKRPLLFVIIEPDIGYELRQEAWVKEHQNDGRIVSEKTFPSGIVVQKRIH